ncbi:MAG: hypothetical protein LBF59_01720 [Prevotellaceae bacterium]|jgi:hypothetical protein|nr:hypothetical protein [Prevotellaceae bacterium]
MKKIIAYIKICVSLYIICLLFSFTGEENQHTTVFEKVYLHLDRHYYLSGDDIWFKAYLIDAQTNELSPKSSRILYAELISPESKILIRRILYVDTTGCSIGDFKLKKSAVSGKYRIRAYTKWMLNFDDVFVFEKEIDVQNIPDESESESESGDTKKKRKNKAEKPDETVITREDVEIEFFPESGSLVLGIENTVAFKATDWSGKGVNVNGGVINSNGDTIVLFSSEYLGTGKFVFTPKTEGEYYAFFIPENVPYPSFAQLPEPLNKGFTINVSDDDTAFVLNIRCNPLTYDEFADKTIFLVFRQSEKYLFAHEIILDADSKLLSLPKSMLPAGITRIILYDEQEKPYCERLVYVENRKEIDVQIISAGDSSSVIKLIDNKGQPVRANMSMSITNSIVPDETFDIESYLWLESEVKGKIERPAAYFDTANHDRFKQIDLLLLTQGWRDYVWIHAENSISEFAGYQPERGLQISGRVKRLLGKKPYPNANITMYFPHLGLDKGIRATQTDSLGNYNFGYIDFWGNQNMYLDSKSKKNKDAGEIFINPVCMPEDKFPVEIWRQYQTDSTYQLHTARYNKDYKLTDTVALDPVRITAKNPKGHLVSDKEITLEDDSRWASLYNYISTASLYLILPGKSLPNQFYSVRYNYFDIDGNKIYNRVPPWLISMKEVDRVAIYRTVGFAFGGGTKHTYTIDAYAKYGKFSAGRFPKRTTINGVVTIVADYKHNNLSSVVTGYYEERKFYAPKFNSTVEKQNYFGTYFWQADISTGNNGKCVVNYNPQKHTLGKIRIEGITNEGIPFVKKINNK